MTDGYREDWDILRKLLERALGELLRQFDRNKKYGDAGIAYLYIECIRAVKVRVTRASTL